MDGSVVDAETWEFISIIGGLSIAAFLGNLLAWVLKIPDSTSWRIIGCSLMIGVIVISLHGSESALPDPIQKEEQETKQSQWQ